MINENRIEDALRALFDEPKFAQEPSGLYDPLRYMIAIGGKRLRPRLCLTTYSLFKDVLDESILQPAASLEIFHSFTLIHDDIMDKSPLRRKRETIWKKWSEDTAILSGDVMCIESYRRLAMAPATVLCKAMELFTRTAAQVCEGQQYDMDFETRNDVSMEEYMQMIGLKTGVLIACSAKMGALIAGAPDDVCEKLYQYGYHMGLAFQVADDYLDAYGDEKIFGKPIGGDIVNNKKCWLTTMALKKANESQAKTLAGILVVTPSSQAERMSKINEVKAIYDALDIAQEAKVEIIRLTEKALEYAAEACKGESLEALRIFADKLIGRSN